MANKRKKIYNFEYLNSKVESLHNSRRLRKCDKLFDKLDESFLAKSITKREYEYLHDMLMLYVTDKYFINLTSKVFRIILLIIIISLGYVYINFGGVI